MGNTVSNDDDRDRYRATEHTVTFMIDPQMGPQILAMSPGIILRSVSSELSATDYPTKVGMAVLAYLRTARRIALDEADEIR